MTRNPKPKPPYTFLRFVVEVKGLGFRVKSWLGERTPTMEPRIPEWSQNSASSASKSSVARRDI